MWGIGGATMHAPRVPEWSPWLIVWPQTGRRVLPPLGPALCGTPPCNLLTNSIKFVAEGHVLLRATTGTFLEGRGRPSPG